jgi:hypothetical protein
MYTKKQLFYFCYIEHYLFLDPKNKKIKVYFVQLLLLKWHLKLNVIQLNIKHTTKKEKRLNYYPSKKKRNNFLFQGAGNEFAIRI